MPNLRILVTGGAGFIGSNFLHLALHEAGVPAGCCPQSPVGRGDLTLFNLDKMTYAGDPANLAGIESAARYRFTKTDICDGPAVARAVQDFLPDAIVHFAAESHVDRSIESGLEFARTNVVGTQVLLDAARKADVGRFVHVSTDEVYGSRTTGSFRETDGLEPSSPYSASKAGSDLMVLAHHKTYGTRACVVRCTNNYGPRQHHEKLIPKTIERALRDQPVPVYARGANVRDWIYVDDTCAAIRTVLRVGRAGEVYNVAGSNEHANLALVRQILGILGKPETLIQFVADRPGHDFRYSLDDSKLRAEGWAPAIALSEGLRRTVTWYKAKHKEVTTA